MPRSQAAGLVPITLNSRGTHADYTGTTGTICCAYHNPSNQYVSGSEHTTKLLVCKVSACAIYMHYAAIGYTEIESESIATSLSTDLVVLWSCPHTHKQY